MKAIRFFVSHNTMTTAFDAPTELSQEEFNDLLDQIRSDDFTEENIHDELMDAARFADIDVVRAILHVYEAAGRYQRESDGNTALHMACANGHLNIVELLLLRDSELTLHLVQNASGNTPLHWAASNGKIKVVKRLLQLPGVDVLLKNKAGRSILTEGFSSNVEAVIAALLEHETATEERLLDSGGKTDEESPTSITHDFKFGTQFVSIRELAIPSSRDKEDLSIIGQAESTDDLTGYAIWASSLIAADWVARLGAEVFKTHSVLELGSGCGLPGLVVASLNTAKSVVTTDWNEAVVENLRYNVKLNLDSGKPFTPVSAHSMNWQDQSSWPVSTVDILVGSDLIYQDDMVDTLLSTVAALQPSRFLYVAGTQRQGHDRFISTLRESYDCTETIAPTLSNPLVGHGDEYCFMHFNELYSMEFTLYNFVLKASEQ